ncbi:uncharacterized protein LOC118275523 [Spodoptera frugiperda]|uniref:Uncharacterized protein LOC118275523 n=1 Tax=Spodoptera frugiperda TaxID=7108 RepID=A0A9R0DDZ6_SPOFR|nr:uncharacterized protein LOC118275523 [Spodoptera frugiperda]
MYSNMCLRIAVCLALVACATSHVLKHQELPLSSEGMILEITVKNKGDDHPLSSMVVDINEKDRKVSITVQEPAATAPKGTVTVPPDGVPTIGNRHGIVVGTCPLGYSKRGGFCFPDDDY